MPAIPEPSHREAPSAAPSSRVQRPRLAYLLSRYPAISHTFFLNEVLGLRALGVEVHTASVNSPDRALHALPAVEAREADTTLYLKQGSKARLGLRILAVAASHPAVLVRGLKAVRRVPHLTARKRLLWMAYLAEALLLGAWMRERGLPHLHVHFGGPVASVGYLTSVAWSVPYSLMIHGPEELQDYTAFQMREKVAQAAFVLCISDFARSQLMQRLPVEDWQKLEVVRLGVTEEWLRASEGVDGDLSDSQMVRVICVGRLVPEKGQRLLLEAVAALRARGANLHVTLVGGGSEQAALKAFTQSHDLVAAVTFAGPCSHDETQALLRQADVFVLASFAEGIPVALMEAMAFRIPCLSTTVAGIGELIRHGEDGLLVAPSNVEALTDALGLLVSDASLRARLGEAGRRRVLDQYRLKNNLEKLAEVFSKRLQAVAS